MKRYFIGPKQKTIENTNFFDGSITLFGDNSKNNISYHKELCFEYWDPDNNNREIDFYNSVLNGFTEEIELMAHNPHLVSKCQLPKNIKQICLNNQELLNILDNKIKTRELLRGQVPMLTYYNVLGSEFKFKNFSHLAKKIVVQLPEGSGGAKTFLYDKTNEKHIIEKMKKNETYTVSAYQPNNIPYNIHCVISKSQIIIFPPSEQDLEITDKIEYIGSKYDIIINEDVKSKIQEYSKIICSKLQQLGYLGVLGIDYIYANSELYFIEINPRFQGSTVQLDKILKNHNLPSIFEYNYNAFNNSPLKVPNLF